MTWRKSSRSADAGQCVEIVRTGHVRDSKNPTGPTLAVDLPALVDCVKAGQFNR